MPAHIEYVAAASNHVMLATTAASIHDYQTAAHHLRAAQFQLMDALRSAPSPAHGVHINNTLDMIEELERDYIRYGDEQCPTSHDPC